MNDYGGIALELVVGFLALFIFTKMMGKTHFSQLTPFDFISVLILGELLGNAIYDREVHLGKVLFATSLWAILIFTSLTLTQKFKKLRKTLEGEPSIMIRNGSIMYKVMQQNKMDLNQLQSLIRQRGFLSVQDVQYAILETNGTLSVFPKPEKDTTKLGDMQLKREPQRLPVTLILDGELIHDNFVEAGVDEAWLRKQLELQGIPGYEDVLLAEWKSNQELYVQRYS